jgi:hypothetical protein
VSSSAGRLLNGRWPNFVPTSDSAPVTVLMLLNARRLDHLDRVVRAGSHHLRAELSPASLAQNPARGVTS